MKKWLVLIGAITLLFGLVTCVGAVTFTIYDGLSNSNAQSNWENASPNFLVDTFTGGALNPGVTVISTNGASDIGDMWTDNVTPPPNPASTQWNFATAITGWGGLFDLAGPGPGPGCGIALSVHLVSGSNVTVPSIIDRNYSGQFFGFTVDSPFDSVTLIGDSQEGTGESYTMDNMHYSNVPIPPAVWLFGSGLLCIAAVRRFSNR
jgi:hypothetical protein